MAATPNAFDYFRRGRVYPYLLGPSTLGMDYYRRQRILDAIMQANLTYVIILVAGF